MWKIREVKKNGKSNIKRNYGKIVLLCLIIAIFAGGHSEVVGITDLLKNDSSYTNSIDGVTDSSELESYDKNLGVLDQYLKSKDDSFLWNQVDKYQPTKGALSPIFNNITANNSIVLGILNTIDNKLKGGSIVVVLTSILGALIFIFLQLLVKNVIIVGEKRFFLENRKYKTVEMNRVLMPYSVIGGYKSGITIFVMSIYKVLWNITIIGGFIKYFSYYMVPYILAENPILKPNEAISISRKMMNGNKGKVFKLELTFIGWHILNLATLGILSIFFLNPYLTSTRAELYMVLRAEALSNEEEYSYAFVDSALDGEFVDGEYDINKYPLPARKTLEKENKEVKDFDISYPIINLILMFFLFSIIGWCWEVSLHLFKHGEFVNRGTMHGPWLPIYGSGGVLMLVLLKRFSHSVGKVFGLSMIVAGILEYSTATLLWNVKHMKWWDYTGYFMNINGRICLEGLLVFAIAGIAVIYIIAPSFNKFLNKMPQNGKRNIAVILAAIFTADAIYSSFIPNTGKGITSYKGSDSSKGN